MRLDQVYKYLKDQDSLRRLHAALQQPEEQGLFTWNAMFQEALRESLVDLLIVAGPDNLKSCIDDGRVKNIWANMDRILQRATVPIPTPIGTLDELSQRGAIQNLAEEFKLLKSPHRDCVDERRRNLAARDALIDLIKFFGPEETQKCIEIANLKKFGE